MRNFRIQDRAAPNLSCATGLSVESILRIRTSPKRFSATCYAQWPIFVKANGIDAAKVEILNVGFAVREPMLVSGHVDAITGFSFSTYVNVKHSGVAQDDIVVLLMANYGVSLYGNTIMVNPSFAADKPQAVRGFLRGFLKGAQGHHERAGRRHRVRAQTQRDRQQGDRA